MKKETTTRWYLERSLNRVEMDLCFLEEILKERFSKDSKTAPIAGTVELLMLVYMRSGLSGFKDIINIRD